MLAYAGSVDTTDPDILLALGLLVLVGLRLCAFQSSRAIARAGLARLAGRGGGRAAAAPVSVVLLWVASMALAVQLTAHCGAGDPEALLPLRELAASVGALAAIAAGGLWILGPPRPPAPWAVLGDRRLSEAAKRLGVSTEEVALQAIDAGLQQFNTEEG